VLIVLHIKRVNDPQFKVKTKQGDQFLISPCKVYTANQMSNENKDDHQLLVFHPKTECALYNSAFGAQNCETSSFSFYSLL